MLEITSCLGKVLASLGQLLKIGGSRQAKDNDRAVVWYGQEFCGHLEDPDYYTDMMYAAQVCFDADLYRVIRDVYVEGGPTHFQNFVNDAIRAQYTWFKGADRSRVSRQRTYPHPVSKNQMYAKPARSIDTYQSCRDLAIFISTCGNQDYNEKRRIEKMYGFLSVQRPRYFPEWNAFYRAFGEAVLPFPSTSSIPLCIDIHFDPDVTATLIARLPIGDNSLIEPFVNRIVNSAIRSSQSGPLIWEMSSYL